MDEDEHPGPDELASDADVVQPGVAPQRHDTGDIEKRKDGAAAQHSESSLREKFPALRKGARS